MFWQFGRHFIKTAPPARQRSSSSSASRAGRMNRNAGEKFRKRFGQSEDDIVRHIHGTEILSRRSIRIMDAFVGKQDNGIHRRAAHELRQMVGIDRFEIAFERAGRNAELAQHEAGKPLVPALQPQPSARAGHAVAHHVDMHVDPPGRP